MLAALAVVVPIFAVVLAGYTVRRAGIFGPSASSELNRFVVWLGLPALLFSITAEASWSELYQPGFAASFALGCLPLFAITVWLRSRRRPLADASIDGLAASYANTGYVGFPLALAVFGPASLTGVTIASLITTCVLFALAIVLVEIDIQDERRIGPLLLKVGGSLARNPLVVAPVAGVIVSGMALPVPDMADTFLKLLGAAASPCALVGLGTFLADDRPVVAGDRGGELALSLSKLILHPALTFIFAHFVFALPKASADLAVLLAAISTGTGPFMLAEYYRRDGAVTAKVILVTTLGSILTLALFLYVSGYGHLPG